MQKKTMKNSFYFIFIVLLAVTGVIPNYKADLISINYTGTGNLFPDENCSLIMTNASVLFDTYYSEQYNQIFVRFDGKYTIYNPNTSQNITLAAPFSSEFENLESTCAIKGDDDLKSFTFFQYHWSDPWAQYLDSADLGMTDIRNFILSNVTFPENSSVKIQYSFEAYIIQPDSNNRLVIYYDVGTSRAWNGSITERVEFKTHGKLPDSYSKEIPESYNYTCIVSDLANGKSYAWEWVDDKIMINSVYISYSYPYRYILGRIAPFIIFGCYFGVPVIIGLILRRRSKRKKRISINSSD